MKQALAILGAVVGLTAIGLFFHFLETDRSRGWMMLLMIVVVLILAYAADAPRRAEIRKRSWLDLADVIERTHTVPTQQPRKPPANQTSTNVTAATIVPHCVEQH